MYSQMTAMPRDIRMAGKRRRFCVRLLNNKWGCWKMESWLLRTAAEAAEEVAQDSADPRVGKRRDLVRTVLA